MGQASAINRSIVCMGLSLKSSWTSSGAGTGTVTNHLLITFVLMTHTDASIDNRTLFKQGKGGPQNKSANARSVRVSEAYWMFRVLSRQ